MPPDKFTHADGSRECRPEIGDVLKLVCPECKALQMRDLPYDMTAPDRCTNCGTRWNRNSAVNHPAYYGGANNPYEAIKVIDAWGLGFSLGNTVKYISRAGRKDQSRIIEDLEKARWYLDHEIERLRAAKSGTQA